MGDTQTTDAREDVSEDQSGFVNYLPGMPRLSTTPSRVERFLTRLFRRRGGVRVVLRRRD